jgi:deferrochelatase/peroxidase EfeB
VYRCTSHSDDFFDNREKLNNFKHSGQIGVQRICPLAAHVRKMNPRDDLTELGFNFDKNRMLRRGIQFGEEVTPEEYKSGKTADGTDRGLIFVCYQANIANSFVFVQQSAYSYTI